MHEIMKLNRSKSACRIHRERIREIFYCRTERILHVRVYTPESCRILLLLVVPVHLIFYVRVT